MFKQLLLTIGLGLLISSCGTNPYKESNKVYEQQLKVLQQKLAEKEAINENVKIYLNRLSDL